VKDINILNMNKEEDQTTASNNRDIQSHSPDKQSPMDRIDDSASKQIESGKSDDVDMIA